jgi:hypothetical protein
MTFVTSGCGTLPLATVALSVGPCSPRAGSIVHHAPNTKTPPQKTINIRREPDILAFAPIVVKKGML